MKYQNGSFLLFVRSVLQDRTCLPGSFGTEPHLVSFQVEFVKIGIMVNESNGAEK